LGFRAYSSCSHSSSSPFPTHSIGFFTKQHLQYAPRPTGQNPRKQRGNI
jgi:hypothetical protein